MKTGPTGKPNTARMQFRLSVDLHQRLKNAARADGMSLSAFLRDMFARHVTQNNHAGKRKIKTA